MEESIETTTEVHGAHPPIGQRTDGILAMGKVDCKVKKIAWMITQFEIEQSDDIPESEILFGAQSQLVSQGGLSSCKLCPDVLSLVRREEEPAKGRELPVQRCAHDA